MESSKFLKVVIVILLLINIATLGFMFMQRPPHGGPPPPMDAGNYIAHKLNFTNDQQDKLEQLRDENRNIIENLRRHSKDLHDDYFDLLQNQLVDSNNVNVRADSILANQKQIELATFYHFQKIRAICTTDQQKKFDDIIKDALRMMAPRPGPGP
jgi:protein CpxP